MTQQRPQLTDVEAIRHRYAMERDKRIREGSNGQYVDIEGGVGALYGRPLSVTGILARTHQQNRRCADYRWWQ